MIYKTMFCERSFCSTNPYEISNRYPPPPPRRPKIRRRVPAVTATSDLPSKVKQRASPMLEVTLKAVFFIN